MRAGQLDKRIQIQKRDRVRSKKSGELVDGWTNIGTPIWAELVNQAAAERYVGRLEVSAATMHFRVRAQPGLLRLTPDKHRVVWNAMELNIRGITEIQRRQGALITCEGRAEGLTGEGKPG